MSEADIHRLWRPAARVRYTQLPGASRMAKDVIMRDIRDEPKGTEDGKCCVRTLDYLPRASHLSALTAYRQ
jgi:hypothetical protein